MMLSSVKKYSEEKKKQVDRKWLLMSSQATSFRRCSYLGGWETPAGAGENAVPPGQGKSQRHSAPGTFSEVQGH